jgi:hypothetical protein
LNQVRVSYVEIYLEKIRDLLNPANDNLNVREGVASSSGSGGGAKGVWIEGVTEVYVSSVAEVLALIDQGANNRSIAATRCVLLLMNSFIQSCIFRPLAVVFQQFFVLSRSIVFSIQVVVRMNMESSRSHSVFMMSLNKVCLSIISFINLHSFVLTCLLHDFFVLLPPD